MPRRFKKKLALDFEKNSLVQGTTVLTMYNKRMYRIESVDFEKSPMITFAK